MSGATPIVRPPDPGRQILGPWRALALILLLPLLVAYLWICLSFNQAKLFFPTSLDELLTFVWFLLHMMAPTWKAVVIYGCWLALQVLLQILVPGKKHQGQPLADGSRLDYKLNGWLCWWITLAVVGAAVALGLPPTLLADELGPLITTATICTILYSLWLFWKARRRRNADRIGGNVMRDFFLGASLNPRTLGFDHKLFCEARPGLILWVLIDLSLAAKQFELHGLVTVPMILVCFFHFWYVADYFLHEQAILTTWDIKRENFGFMLCFGDLVWVPFTYTLQAQYLVAHTHQLPWWAAAGIVLLNLLGFVAFRGANLQKHSFRMDPKHPVWGKPPVVIRTAQGTPLLASGWWGISRHANYLGDLIMGLAWCLPCLFGSPLPYFYIVYFTVLLVQRERRDNAACLAKYGKDWEEYTRRVRFRILPGIY